MRSFENISQLIRQKRLEHHKHYSQAELSQILGYKNGQFISNVERGLCSIPLKMLKRVAQVLDISPMELRESLLADFHNTLDEYFKMEGQVRNSKNVAENAVSEEQVVL